MSKIKGIIYAASMLDTFSSIRESVQAMAKADKERMTEKNMVPILVKK